MFASRISRVSLQFVRAIGRTNTQFAATLRHKNNLSILARGLCTAPKEDAKGADAGKSQDTSIARRMIDNDGYDDYETTEKQSHVTSKQNATLTLIIYYRQKIFSALPLLL